MLLLIIYKLIVKYMKKNISAEYKIMLIKSPLYISKAQKDCSHEICLEELLSMHGHTEHTYSKQQSCCSQISPTDHKYYYNFNCMLLLSMKT